MGDDLTEESPEDMTIGAIFNRLCPYYLSIGMPYDLFWNGDVSAAVSYRKAYEYEKQRKNYEFWLQGMYIYSALCDVSPVLHAFAKSGTKPKEYMSEPIPMTVQDNKKAEERRQKKSDTQAKAYLEMFMVSFNKRFEEGGKKDG